MHEKLKPMLKPMLKPKPPPQPPQPRPSQPQARAFDCASGVSARAAASSPAIAIFFMFDTSFRSPRAGPASPRVRRPTGWASIPAGKLRGQGKP